MTKIARLWKNLIAAGLCAALVLLSPGLPAYQAFAGMIEGGAGRSMPLQAALPLFQGISSPDKIARFANVTVKGVEIGPVLSGMAKLDLSAAEINVGPAGTVMRALADLPSNAPDWLVLQTIANVANLSRDNAKTWLTVAKTPDLGPKALASLEQRLKAHDDSSFLLDARTRVGVSLELVRTRERLEAARMAKAGGDVAAASKAWEKSGPGAIEKSAVAGSEGTGAPALSRSTPSERRAAPKVSLNLAPRTAAASAKPLDWSGLAWMLGIAAAAAAFVASPVALWVGAGAIGSILLHETAHLWMLRRLGDGTAAAHGVKSLNPLKLVDPLRTFILPMVTLALSTSLFHLPILLGAAKPVPVDFNKLKDPKRDAAKVAIAGPAMNAILAAAFFTAALFAPGVAALALLAKINLSLALFNMLPMPQLDGGKVLVGFLPAKLYDRWVRNDKVAEPYRNIFTKLYEGPSLLLNLIGMTGQGQVNGVTRMITWGAFAVFAAGAWWLGGLPVLLLMLVCSYDYYCIREKIQNENAVRQLMDIMLGFASELAKIAEEDDSIQSVINTEKVEHSMKNALEDTIDKVVDSDGFDGLSAEDKWKRLESAYMDAATAALKKEGMTADSEETIRRVLNHPRSRVFLDQIKKWIEDNEVFEKWHSEGRKKKLKDIAKGKLKEHGGALGMVAIGLLTGGMLGGGAFITGTVEQTEKPAPVSFNEAMAAANLQISPKEQGFLQLMLTEMKLEEKPPVMGRVDEMGKVYKNVTAPRGDINSTIIVGKAGTGKTAIPEKLAQAIVLSETSAPGSPFELKKMQGRFLVKLNLARLLTQDDPAASLDALLNILGRFNESDKRSGNKVVLFIDEIHQLFAHAKGEQMANLLKEPLRDGSLSIIAATTDKEYKKYMENDEAFRRRMFLIRMDEATIPETMRMLQGSKAYYEGLYQSEIHPDALKAAAEMSKFDQEVFLPGRAFKYLLLAAKEADFDGQRDRLAIAIADKMGDLQYVTDRIAEESRNATSVTQKMRADDPTTIELMNSAAELTKELVAMYRRREAIPTEGRPVVTADLVKDEIASNTGVAAGQLTLGQEPVERYLEMEKELGKDVIGQDEAVHAVSEAVRRNKAGLSDPNLPIARLLFTGPTGSGKTHLAKKLAKFLFKDEGAVIRVDMSEYMESHSVSKFTGAPPGYVGFAEGGQLTEAVRKKPYSVILFDELEKAHPDVFDILLQILGDGRLTDGQGRTTDFKNTVILMTSNLAQSALNDLLETYIARWQDLSRQQEEAGNDKVKLLAIKQAKKELSAELAAETKAVGEKVTTEAMKRSFKPEFEGRLSGPPIVFNRVTPEMASQIVELNMRDLRGVLGQAGHELSWNQQVVDLLADKGFDIRLGARPLKNAIDGMVTQTIARRILESARDNGGRVPPSKIAASVQDGKIVVNVEALPPRKVVAKDPEAGATEAVFMRVLNNALQAAAGQATEEMTLETVDGWVREALNAFPDMPAVSEGKAAAEPTAGAETSPKAKADAAPAPKKTPAATGVLKNESVTLGANVQRAEAGHYDADRKDPAVKDFQKKLAEAMEAAGWPEKERYLAVRTVEDPANPYYGFLKLFVEHAKQQTPGDRRANNVGLAFEIDGDTLKVVVHRNGAIDERELETLKRHFGGKAPLTAQQSRDDAEQIVVALRKDGRRLWFDLHRQLAKVPGAKIGYATGKDAQGGAGTDYWLELRKPAPPPEPEPPAQEERAQEPGQEPPQQQNGGDLPVELLTADVAPAVAAPELGQHESKPLKVDAAMNDDVHIRTSRMEIAHKMGEMGHTRAARVAAAAFLETVSDFMKQRALPEGGEVEVHWKAEISKATILLTSRGAALTPEQIEVLHALFANQELKQKMQDADAKIRYGSGDKSLDGRGASVWLELGAWNSQADGQASSSAEAPAASPENGAWTDTGLKGPLSFVIAQNTTANPQDASVRQAYQQISDVLEGVGARAEAIAAAQLFIDRALRFAKERARETPTKITVEWRRVGNNLEVAVRRELDQNIDPVDTRLWLRSVLEEPGLADYLRGQNTSARVIPVAMPLGKTASKVAVRIPLPTTTQPAEGEIDLQKIITPDPVPANARLGLFWVRFRAGLDYERDIAPLIFNLGLTHVTHWDAGNGYNVQVSVPDGAWLVAHKALDLSKRREVLEVEVLPAALQEAMRLEEEQRRESERRAPPATPTDVRRNNPARRPGSNTPIPPQPSGPTAQGPSSTGDRVRDLARQLAYGILNQGHDRGPTVRMGAADVLGAASSREDLAKAREWLQLTDQDKWAFISAGANVVARHGSREEDAAQLRRLLIMYSGNNAWGHEKNPGKRRIINAFAKIHETDNPARVRELMRELEAAKEAGSGQKQLFEALYVTLCKTGDAQARELLMTNWDNSRAIYLAEYLLRVDPAYLRRLHETWQRTHDRPDGADRPLTLWALAAFGDESDLPHFFRLMRDRWGAQLDGSTAPPAAEAFSKFVARIGAYRERELRAELRGWIQEDLDSDSTFTHVVTAVITAGENGSEEDLPELERIMRTDPESSSTISNYHEMTQHEAAVSWAKIVYRTGLARRWLTENEPAQGDRPAMPRIMRMLTEQNGVINKAALETLKLLFEGDQQPPAPAPRPAANAPRQNIPSGGVSGPRADFFTPGRIDQTPGQITTFLNQDPGTPGAGVEERLSSSATAWLNALGKVVSRVLGVEMERSLTRASNGALIWRLRAISPASFQQEQEAEGLIRKLLDLSTQRLRQDDELARLARTHPEIEAAFRALYDLSRMPGVTMGMGLQLDGKPAAFLKYGGSAAHPLFEEGEDSVFGGNPVTHFRPEAEVLADANSGYSRVSAAQRAVAEAWRTAFGVNFTTIFANPLDDSIKIKKDGANMTVVWTLRQRGNQPIEAERLTRARELMYVLLHLLNEPQAVREQRLNELTREVHNVRPLFRALQQIASTPGFKIGMSHDPSRAGTPGRGGIELWLKLEIMHANSSSSPTFAQFKNEMLERRFGRGHLDF